MSVNSRCAVGLASAGWPCCAGWREVVLASWPLVAALWARGYNFSPQAGILGGAQHRGHQRPPAQHILIRGHLQLQLAEVGGETVSGDQPRNLAWIHQYTAAKSSHSPCYNLLGIELFAAYEHVECLHFTFSQHFTTSTFQGEVISAAVSARV